MILSDATNSFAPFAHFGYRLASDKAAEFGKEAPVVADGEGPVALSDCNRIRSPKPVRAVFKGAYASGAEGFGRNEADGALATLAVYADAPTLDVLK